MSDINVSLPFPESYWVVPGLFMAGQYPAGYDELQTRKRLQGLLAAGIVRFVDLTHPNDCKSRYDNILEDEANGYLKIIKYIHLPIPDFSVTTQQNMTRILDAIDSAMEAREPVYVHCVAGLGRTGTVVGCYLVRHGLTGSQALAEITRLRSALPSGYVRSPEADEQVNFVRHWKPGS